MLQSHSTDLQHTQKQKQKQTQRHTHTRTHRHTDTRTHGHTHTRGRTHTHTDRHTHTWTRTHRQTDTDTQTDTHRHTDRHTHTVQVPAPLPPFSPHNAPLRPASSTAFCLLHSHLSTSLFPAHTALTLSDMCVEHDLVRHGHHTLHIHVCRQLAQQLSHTLALLHGKGQRKRRGQLRQGRKGRDWQ